MNKVYLFLTTGFEEIEAIAPIDILRRAGIDVKLVSLESGKQVSSSRNVVVTADMMFDEVDFSTADMLVLPGGTTRINEHGELKKRLLVHAQAGRKIAAICAAPMVLGGLGLLKGRRATVFPGYEKYMEGAFLTKTGVVVDGNIITGRAAGYSLEFALKLVEILQGKDKSDEVAGNLQG
jgi:4-methyl-5(b-hydroxyethyl)-thiazole monophosphate biosynthesis